MAEKPKTDESTASRPSRSRSRASGGSFISHLVEDPANPPDVVLLAGYLGDAAEDGKTRLYLRPDLSDYLDIPSDAIVHQQGVAGDPLGAVYVWVRRDAEVTRKGSSGEPTPATLAQPPSQ
jgi:hypothetical protein